MTAEREVTLRIAGVKYGGWTSMKVSRGIDRCVGDFDAEVSERWGNQSTPWQIKPFQVVQVYAGSDLMLTGYIDEYEPEADKDRHTVKIAGRSKTQDLVDCSTELDTSGGEYDGSTLVAICRAVCEPFHIKVVAQSANASQVPTDTVRIQNGETAFAFLERLGRLCGVLLTDNEAGDLVLTDAGQATASSSLLQGDNILKASAKLNVSAQFSKYVIKSQTGMTGEEDENDNDIYAEAFDATVPRYRPHISIAESALDEDRAQQRVNWQRNHAAGRAVQAHVTVEGWRQADGSLWRPNQMISVTIPFLSIDALLLVVKVEFEISNGTGFTTNLELGPVSGYTPDPGQVKMKKGNAGASGMYKGFTREDGSVIK